MQKGRTETTVEKNWICVVCEKKKSSVQELCIVGKFEERFEVKVLKPLVQYDRIVPGVHRRSFQSYMLNCYCYLSQQQVGKDFRWENTSQLLLSRPVYVYSTLIIRKDFSTDHGIQK
mmetsp:Transcript_926/g.2359  ORF Transcript_926/g.2359 Transcript_926/m.2359 type:complete len:117 (+) Transcript_926:806-1156(+)